MNERKLPIPEVPPAEAAVSAKCKNCMIEFTGNVDNIHGIKPKLSALGTWIWVTDCPKCGELICFSELFAEEEE